MHRIRNRASLAFLAATAALLAGCSSPGAGAPTTAPNASAPPVITNCGVDVEIRTAPQRVVTIKSSTTEALLALGLGDRIVGTAFQDGPVPAALQVDPAPPVLAERMPGAEAVLAATPDLVFSGWESAFTADAIGTRAELAQLGVATYVWPSACTGEHAPSEVTFDSIAADLEQLASIFGADAAPVLAEQRATLDAIEPATGSALWWSSGTETPFVGAGDGAPELILETAGLTNIAADQAGGWSPYNWESVIEADPDVIVVVDAAWNTAEHKIEYLRADPVLSQLRAVQAGAFVTVPFAASEAGVRTAEAAASVAEQVAALP